MIRTEKNSKNLDKINLNVNKIFEKNCLKAIVAYITDKKEWVRRLSVLNKITSISNS